MQNLTLTTQQRLAAYEYAREAVIATQFGICTLLRFWSHSENIDIIYSCDVIDFYPEILKQRPEDHGRFWWPRTDRQSRLDALDRAIDLVRKEIEKNSETVKI